MGIIAMAFTMHHILIVDDDARLCSLLARTLAQAGFATSTANSVAQAKQVLAVFTVDALVLDVMMPTTTGLEWLAELRGNNNALLVLLLTALGEAENRIAGLQAGADDYLAKPFAPQELVLRLKNLVRRLPVEASLQVGQWHYAPEQRLLHKEGEECSLTSTEHTLLLLLLEAGGQPVSRDILSDAIAQHLAADSRALDVHIMRLRRKIEPASATPRHLITVRGKGYCLV
jgi:two-component system, OmpR family, phosphate regulon response regulator OmpR